MANRGDHDSSFRGRRPDCRLASSSEALGRLILFLWRRRESNGGPAMLPEHVGAIRSAVSGEESGGWAESQESGSAPEDAGGSGACSSVARGPARADMLQAILAARGGSHPAGVT